MTGILRRMCDLPVGSQQRHADYLRHSHLCPFCGSSNITASRPEISGDDIWVDVVCNSCERDWVDEYELIHANITENEEDQDGEEEN
jgi:hypothetical protein